jgi:hypothetical protein
VRLILFVLQAVEGTEPEVAQKLALPALLTANTSARMIAPLAGPGSAREQPPTRPGETLTATAALSGALR